MSRWSDGPRRRPRRCDEGRTPSMTHLHIGDGVLPAWLWASGLGLALVLAGLASYAHRHDRADRLALLSALSAVLLAAMSVPLRPLIHLSHASLVVILLLPGLIFLAAPGES